VVAVASVVSGIFPILSPNLQIPPFFPLPALAKILAWFGAFCWRMAHGAMF